MHELRRKLVNKTKKKILMVVLDGVGGLPNPVKTELEAAKTPNLNKLAKKSETGVHIPILHGLTPGSGSAHLALFGYDPLAFDIGRGVLEALGLDMKVTDKDIAIRGNFATVKKINNKIVVTDRRAGRINTSTNKRIINKLKKEIKKIDNVYVDFKSGLEHRFVCKLSFKKKLSKEESMLSDTDPQVEGLSPLKPIGLNKKSKSVEKIIKKLINRISNILSEEKNANYVLLRGFSTFPKIPTFNELYDIKSCSITTYPMYKGIAALVGMKPEIPKNQSIVSQVQALSDSYNKYDFFYLHVKKTDSYGEDGNYKKKIQIIEEFDKVVPKIQKIGFDVITITGDHSTPAKMKSHSWHPVPILINSKNSFYGNSQRFTEKECLKGTVGTLEAKNLLNIIFAHADMLNKFGA
ncbi:MAG: 2,3-bisphosphoglycerate-independent phosphoglycerate mutase [Thermodesulfobacteriota bacterium]|nr:2,3-bisphosphoglycerate-independent phosphoglycerate mutase [Thermodesulfobacteriota bacterium]MEE2974948.1 2,3-bisphosphoglycerate-independent phosphoglycerate mutase [Thermodesulfobacteriota bacterium]|tara:strand:- start:14460 stop:15683 length:1224 start_codon:yes stop_codon:yes gene_type:complete